MKRSIVILLVMFIGLNLSAQNQKNFIDQNYIEVKGVAELEVVPNEIYVNIVLDEKDTKNKESIEQLEQKMFAALERAGIDIEKQLSVSDFSSNLKYHFFKGSNVLKSKKFELLVNDSHTLAKVYIELEKIRISNVNILRVDHSEIEKYRKQVKINAIKAGKEKAEALTEAIGEKIGKAIYINENSSHVRNDYANTAFKIRGSSSLAKMYVPKLDFQKIKLEYSVHLRFKIL
ncbi:SIMPL domain-containing protein [Marinifilum sp.]|uniref:SIMPL domain-containing protein n=1 Tax=Marinifilum sp. TaxID=2033137 RepID=UPI003BAB9A25